MKLYEESCYFLLLKSFPHDVSCWDVVLNEIIEGYEGRDAIIPPSILMSANHEEVLHLEEVDHDCIVLFLLLRVDVGELYFHPS